MSDFVEWIPKHHGHKPLHWTPDTLTGLDNKNYVRQPNWAWIAGTTYYVPYEAVHGAPRLAPVDEAATMGDDLIKRLRDWVPAEGPPEGRTAPDAVADMHEAADRIEALQADKAKLREALHNLLDLDRRCGWHSKEADEARAALQETER